MTSYLGQFCHNHLRLSVIFHMIKKKTNFSAQWCTGWQQLVINTMVTLAFIIRCTDWWKRWIYVLYSGMEHMLIMMGKKQTWQRILGASCQVSLNSIQRLLRRSQECHSQSETRVAMLVFQLAWKNSNVGLWVLVPVKFWWILFNSCRGDVSANLRPGRQSWFSH